MKKSLIIFFVICLININLFSQEFLFEKITSRQGLSQNDVNCIYQDKNGFIWIGTNDGLNRYDGYSFKTYRINPNNKDAGLSSNLIFTVKEDKKGRLWIGTSNEGVCVFDKETEKFTQIKNSSANPILLADNRVLDLECMNDGTVWIATEKGVTIISEVKGIYETQNLNTIADSPLVSNGCNEIYQDHKGRVWLGFYRGLIVCQKSKNRYQTTSISGFENNNIRSIIKVPHGYIVGSEKGVYNLKEEFNLKGKIDYSIITKKPSTIVLYDESKYLYVASQVNLLVYAYKKEAAEYELLSSFKQGEEISELSSKMVMSIFKDASGIIWIGTNGGGINKYNPNRKKINHYYATGKEGSLSSNKIRSIYEDSNENLWFGTEGGGLDFLAYDKNRNFTNGFKNFFIQDVLVENKYYSIAETDNIDGETEIWSGAGFPAELLRFNKQGLNIPNNKNKYLPKPNASVFTMIKDREGNMWLGTYGFAGLFKYTYTNNGYKVTNYKAGGIKGSLASNNIRSLLQDKLGNIWIGTDDGLCLLKAEQVNVPKPSFVTFHNIPDDSSSLSNDYILPLFQSSDNKIWIGTMGGGLNLVNYHNNPDSISFKRFGAKQGFPNDVIKGILEDNSGNLWVSSNNGISRFNLQTYTIMNYDISDGLQDNEFGELACCKLKDGMMIFGGVNGFNTFYPEQISMDMTPPTVVFTELQVLNESVDVGEELNDRVILNRVIDETKTLKLKYSENSFAIYFSGLHFSAPQKNRYKYKLEGFDNKWIEKDSKERFAKYTSLKPGTYTFKIFASNNDGIWSEQPKMLEVIIVPPWWMSNVAIIVYLILFVLMLIFFRQFSFIRIKKKNELLMEHFEKEKMEELTHMKFQFFTNISHEFRTPLTLILGSVQKLMFLKEELSEDVNKKCITIQRNSSIMLRLINQLMDFRKIEQDKLQLSVSKVNLIKLLDELCKSFYELAESKQIKFEIINEAKENDLWVDTDKMEKIVYNLLSNAFKFTDIGGYIAVKVKEVDSNFVIQVKDNGIGIPKEDQPFVFDRFFQGKKSGLNGFGGTGIGLSYSKALAELHYGNIQFDSIEGIGSNFELVLKKGNGHFSHMQLESNKLHTERFASLVPQPLELLLNINEENYVQDENSDKKSLLIVEDNIELLHFLKDSFRNDYFVYCAENGEKAFDLLIENDISLVVSDVAMPVKDGFELCKDIKTNENYCHIPVILLTAKTTDEDHIRGYQLGADAYVSKPFDINILEAQVASIINSRIHRVQQFKQNIDINPTEVTTTEADERFLSKLLSIIEENINVSTFSVVQLSEIYGMPQLNINRKLKSLTGKTASNFIRSVKLKRACQLLKTGRYTVADVTYEVGFSDLKYFRSCFKNEFGVNPSDYSKQFKETTIEEDERF